MNCIEDGVLRARLDDELGKSALAQVNAHLAACAACRARAVQIEREAESVRQELSGLAPAGGQPRVDARRALAHFRAEYGEPGPERAPSMLGRIFARRLAPAWGLAAVALVAVLMSFSPARSWAQRVLAMLRVQKITVVSVDLTALPGQGVGRHADKMLGQLISDEMVVTQQPGKPQPAADAATASSLAGFHVRLLSSEAAPPQIEVEGAQAFHLTLNRDRLQAVVNEAGRGNVQLPTSLDGATVAVQIPKVVMTRYGRCPSESDRAQRGERGSGPPPDFSDCVTLVQAPSPTITVPPDLNLNEMAEAGLQIAGLSAADAHAFVQTVDWTSTLAIPIPREISSYDKVPVDGVEGTLITFHPGHEMSPPGYTLLWVKRGIIYSLAGFGDSAGAPALAASLN